jgi:hypothetical protein
MVAEEKVLAHRGTLSAVVVRRLFDGEDSRMLVIVEHDALLCQIVVDLLLTPHLTMPGFII